MVQLPRQDAPLTIIRTETVLSRLPIHTLAKRGQVPLHIIKKNAQGVIELRWEVSSNTRYGPPRQLAYRLDTLIVNRALEAYGRPLPQLIRLDSLTQICHEFGLHISGANTRALRHAFHQNAGAYITAILRYTASDGTEHTLEAGFTRYSVVFTGERLPDGTTAEAVYLVLSEPYREVLNNAPTRPLDYDYLKSLTPAAGRCYELLSYKIFAALKYSHPEAKQLYSEYCTCAAQQRYTDYPHVKKQMYKVHKPHITSEYLKRVRYEATTDADGRPDWFMSYVPGPKAHAEYAAFNPRSRRRAERPTLVPQAAAPEATTRLDVEPAAAAVAPTPIVDEALTTAAHALVQYFHQRFHGAAAVVPASAKALAQAQDLLTQYGVEQARHLVDFSVSAAKETAYQPQTFSGILHYLPRALADYARAQQRQEADARARAERRRAQEDAQRRAQYEAYGTERLAQLRATLPTDVLAAVEQAAAVQFEREQTSPFGRERLRQMAMDNAVAAYGQLPSFAEWQAAHESS